MFNAPAPSSVALAQQSIGPAYQIKCSFELAGDPRFNPIEPKNASMNRQIISRAQCASFLLAQLYYMRSSILLLKACVSYLSSINEQPTQS
jgi:hypothetical protein